METFECNCKNGRRSKEEVDFSGGGCMDEIGERRTEEKVDRNGSRFLDALV
jgi:hypothetical protein